MGLTVATSDVGPRADVLRETFRRVQAEYAEMPGLCLTIPQAQRLWAVDRRTCERVFLTLVARGVLRRTTKERFVRA